MEVVGDAKIGTVDLFAAVEIIAVEDKSSSKIDESKVLVQPLDAVFSEVGQEDEYENEESDDKGFIVRHPEIEHDNSLK